MQQDYKIGSALALICLATFYEIIDGYLLKTPRDTIALLGDRVELDCITNSSHRIDWHFASNHSDSIAKDVGISRGTHPAKNISDSFRIRHDVDGQFSLVIDPVLMSLAGRYTCHDLYEEQTSAAEVTVLNGTPSCNESTVPPSRKLVCTFGYTGNLEPKLEWMTLGNSSWNVSCNASEETVDCVFESSCAYIQSVNAKTVLMSCSGENSTCQWVTGNISSSIGSLRLRGINKTVGSWHCAYAETRVATTTSSNLQDVLTENREIPLLLICVGITSTAIILLLFVFRIKYGICRKKGAAHDVLYDRAMDQVDPTQTQTETITVVNGYLASEPENSPVYAQVQKKRKAQPRTTVIGHDTLVFDNVLYASSKTSGAAKTPSEVSKNNFATDGIIYADLRQVPRETSSRTQRTPMVIREGFDTSTYAFIDHSLRAPALLPK